MWRQHSRFVFGGCLVRFSDTTQAMMIRIYRRFSQPLQANSEIVPQSNLDASLLSNGYREGLSPGVKRPGREADYSPPSNAKVKNFLDTIYRISRIIKSTELSPS
jgi:hypothetical protein